MTYMSEFIGSAFEDSYFNGQHTAQHSIDDNEFEFEFEQGEDIIEVCERLSTHQYRNLPASGGVFERVFLFKDGSILVVNGSDFDYGCYECSPLFDGMVLGGVA